jgi:hypothetical protein
VRGGSEKLYRIITMIYALGLATIRDRKIGANLGMDDSDGLSMRFKEVCNPAKSGTVGP